MHVEDNRSQGPCLVSFLCRPVSRPPQSWRHQPVTHHTKPEVTKFQTLGHIGTPPKLRSTQDQSLLPCTTSTSLRMVGLAPVTDVCRGFAFTAAIAVASLH